MNCDICETNDWHKTGMHTESNLQLCKNCGYCCHEIEPDQEEKRKQYYKSDYRKRKFVDIANLITSQNKRNYVTMFLNEFLMGKKDLLIGDVGAAHGYLCDYFRSLGHRVTGCEYTLYYRRFSEHFYGIPLTEELEPKHKYDLITIYHVLEHIITPAKKLLHYRSLLKDDGHMLIATPRWFKNLDDSSGEPIKSFDYYYHKDHLNVFSYQSIKNLFNKCGLEIVKEEVMAYGQTYLLKKGEIKPIEKENWETHLQIISDQKRAIEFHANKKFREAVDAYYLFPEAQLEMVFNVFGKDNEKQEDYWKELQEKMPDNKRLSLGYGTWLFQRQKFQEALDVFQKVMTIAPTASLLIYIAWCYSHMEKPKEAMRHYYQAGIWDVTKWPETMNAACREACMCKTWDEVAMEKLKEEVFKQHLAKEAEQKNG